MPVLGRCATLRLRSATRTGSLVALHEGEERWPVVGAAAQFHRVLGAVAAEERDEALEETPSRRGSWRWEAGCLEIVR